MKVICKITLETRVDMVDPHCGFVEGQNPLVDTHKYMPLLSFSH